jgi:hypothetical protein
MANTSNKMTKTTPMTPNGPPAYGNRSLPVTAGENGPMDQPRVIGLTTGTDEDDPPTVQNYSTSAKYPGPGSVPGAGPNKVLGLSGQGDNDDPPNISSSVAK